MQKYIWFPISFFCSFSNKILSHTLIFACIAASDIASDDVTNFVSACRKSANENHKVRKCITAL